MSGPGNIVLTVGTATIVNTVYDLQTGKQDVAVTLLAGGAVAAILITVGSGTGSWEIVEAVGVAVLITSLFIHGTKILGINTALESASKNPLSQVSPNREQQQHSGAYITAAGSAGTQNA